MVRKRTTGRRTRLYDDQGALEGLKNSGHEYDPRPAEYLFPQEVQIAIRQRDHDTCVHCGKTETQLDLENFQACESCETPSWRDDQAARKACRHCSVPQRNLQIHHRHVSVSFARDNNIDANIVVHPDNGVCLCASCHDKADRELIQLERHSPEIILASVHRLERLVEEEMESLRVRPAGSNRQSSPHATSPKKRPAENVYFVGNSNRAALR